MTMLSKPLLDVINELAYRAKNHPERPCWLADSAGGNYLLVVPVNDPLSYIAVRRYSGRRLATLHELGLIRYGTEGHDVPPYVPTLTGDTRTGSTVELTADGRAVAEFGDLLKIRGAQAVAG